MTWIKGNILGLVAIFIALGGSAVAVQTKDSPLRPAATEAKKAKKKARRGPMGPAGPQGLQGPPGAAGAPGTPGLSEAITRYSDAPQEIDSPLNPFTIESIDLQPGAYLILAKTVLRETEEVDNGEVSCNLSAEHVNDLSFSRLGNLGDAAAAPEVQVAVVSTQLTDTLTVAQTVTFTCTETLGAGTITASQTKLTALRLGSETHTTP